MDMLFWYVNKYFVFKLNRVCRLTLGWFIPLSCWKLITCICRLLILKAWESRSSKAAAPDELNFELKTGCLLKWKPFLLVGDARSEAIWNNHWDNCKCLYCMKASDRLQYKWRHLLANYLHCTCVDSLNPRWSSRNIQVVLLLSFFTILFFIDVHSLFISC